MSILEFCSKGKSGFYYIRKKVPEDFTGTKTDLRNDHGSQVGRNKSFINKYFVI